jgi:hypothetical protein
MRTGTIESVGIAHVAASTFALCRVTPITGRLLKDADASPASPPVLLIGEKLWRDRFAGDPAIVGRDVMVGETPRTIVGVMPAAFKFPAKHEGWLAIRDELPSIPGVSHATVADALPFSAHDHYVVQMDEGGATPPDHADGHRSSVAAVDRDFFDHFAMLPKAGRLFSPSDYVGRPRVVVVNQLFVDRVLGARNPVGRRVRLMNQESVQKPPNSGDDQPWLEIVRDAVARGCRRHLRQ